MHCITKRPLRSRGEFRFNFQQNKKCGRFNLRSYTFRSTETLVRRRQANIKGREYINAVHEVRTW